MRSIQHTAAERKFLLFDGPGGAMGIDFFKAPAVENFAWLPVGVYSNKPACGSVSLI